MCLKVSAARGRRDSLLAFCQRTVAPRSPTFLKRPLVHTLGPGSGGAQELIGPPLNEPDHAGSSATLVALVRLGARRSPRTGLQSPAAGVTAAGSMHPQCHPRFYARFSQRGHQQLSAPRPVSRVIARVCAGGPRFPLLQLKALNKIALRADRLVPRESGRTLRHSAGLSRTSSP